MSLAVLVLRYKNPAGRQWKVPGNFIFGKREIPVGVILDFRRVVHDRDRESSSPSARPRSAGVTFSAAFLRHLHVLRAPRCHERERKAGRLDQFRVYGNQELGSGAMGVRPGNILVAVRDPSNLYYLRSAQPAGYNKAGCRRDECAPLPPRALFQRQLRL